MNKTEYLSNGKIVFHSYNALKKYCDDPNNPLDKVILGKEITILNGLFKSSWRTNKQFSGIEHWDVSNVTDMSEMFFWATSFNQPIGDWDVSKVTNMSGMFRLASSFNQPIGNWDVSNVTNMRGMFFGAESFNQPIGDWDVSNVTDMMYTFYHAESFNQPIGNWDVSNVTDMSNMFNGAKSFNQPIGDWDVSNVTNMRGMFFGAESFNQPLDNFTEKQKSDAYYFFDKERYEREQEKLTKTSSNSVENFADKVIKLAELKKQGLLTDAEFEMMKADLLK